MKKKHVKKSFYFTAYFAISTLVAQQALDPEKTLEQLTLREKIGQLFMVAAASNFNAPTEQLASLMQTCPYTMEQDHVMKMITDHHVGGVIFLYKSDPITQMTLTQKFQDVAQVPLLIAQDSEWGLSMRLDNDPTKVVRYPRAMTLGALHDRQKIYDVGYEIGKQCAAIGVHMNLAPVADINNNRRNPVIHDRSFGNNPLKVAQRAALFAKGLQDAGVLACAKHFPGHGDTEVDSHLDLPVIKHNRERFKTTELLPFQHVAHQRIDAIMHAHICVPALDATGKPSSLSYPIVTGLLKKELNFNGLSITDGLGMDAVRKNYASGQLELEAFLAGNDLLLCPLDVPQAMQNIEQAITHGDVDEDDLNQRVLKILKAKARAFAQSKAYFFQEAQAYLIRPQAYELQKDLYRSAITLLTYNNQLHFDTNFFDESCIIQIGALPEDYFKNSCRHYGKKVITGSVLPEAAADHDTVVIAIGDMNKFVDKQFGITDTLLDDIKQLKKIGKKVIVALFGTPYSIPLFKDVDAIIEAYEDVPVAQEAVVDTLRGILKPTGTLPIML